MDFNLSILYKSNSNYDNSYFSVDNSHPFLISNCLSILHSINSFLDFSNSIVIPSWKNTVNILCRTTVFLSWKTIILSATVILSLTALILSWKSVTLPWTTFFYSGKQSFHPGQKSFYNLENLTFYFEQKLSYSGQ